MPHASLAMSPSTLLAIVAAYSIGSLPGALLLGRARGVDVRAHGSGNAGGTNALRVLGWRVAIGVVAIDVAKGALGAALGAWLGDGRATPVAAACGFAAVVGHCWPVFFGFRGGKGAATAAGAVLVIAPVFALPLLGTWLLVLVASGYSSLATLAAGVAFPLFAFGASAIGAPVPDATAAFALACAALLALTHRANVARLVRGVEPRFERARLVHRWLRRA